MFGQFWLRLNDITNVRENDEIEDFDVYFPITVR